MPVCIQVFDIQVFRGETENHANGMSSPLISFDLRAFGQDHPDPRDQRRRLVSVIASVLVAVGAAACGGGGGAGLDGTQASTVAAAALTPSAPASPMPAANGLDASAAAGAAALGSDNAPQTLSNSDVVGTARALSATASLALEGVPEAPAPTPPLVMPAGGRVFHVNSQAGDDRNDGRAATAPTGTASTTGPWKSLARVMQSDLGPGDTLVLACGSTWNETLRVPANGTAARPVQIGRAHV